MVYGPSIRILLRGSLAVMKAFISVVWLGLIPLAMIRGLASIGKHMLDRILQGYEENMEVRIGRYVFPFLAAGDGESEQTK
jgi:hypothetical protein